MTVLRLLRYSPKNYIRYHEPNFPKPNKRKRLPKQLKDVNVSYYKNSKKDKLYTETIKLVHFESDYDTRDSVYIGKVKGLKRKIRIKCRYGQNYLSKTDIITLLEGDEVPIVLTIKGYPMVEYLVFEPGETYKGMNEKYTGKFHISWVN